MNLRFFGNKFDEILPEFQRNGQEMTKCLDNLILRKCARKIRKMPEISGIGETFLLQYSSFHYFNPILRSKHFETEAAAGGGGGGDAGLLERSGSSDF